MFGVGPQEMVIIGLIFLVIFGPGSLPKMARDMGRFVSEARRAIDDFKEEITAAGDDEDDDKWGMFANIPYCSGTYRARPSGFSWWLQPPGATFFVVSTYMATLASRLSTRWTSRASRVLGRSGDPYSLSP
jgi:TatA/E family protein of Tat protein translocase